MECRRIFFSGHAVQRMFERGVQKDSVLAVASDGQVIASYMDDTPYPSYLMLGFVEGRALHVTPASDPENTTCFVITAYWPDPNLWDDDFRTRRHS